MQLYTFQQKDKVMARLTFDERNKNNYTKYSDVSIKTINKYKGLLPEELLNIWQNMGFGIFEDGFIQLVNPDEYEFVFDYIDKLLEPSIVFGITALGDLLIWEGNNNWTVAPDEGNRILLQYGQCYGYVPALALGGRASNKNMQVVDAKTYINIIGQAVGKIIDLSE